MGEDEERREIRSSARVGLGRRGVSVRSLNTFIRDSMMILYLILLLFFSIKIRHTLRMLSKKSNLT
jgi:hypothetical protein